MLAPPYCDEKRLARPQLAPGATAFAVPRETAIWGYLVYEMLTCAELTQPALLAWYEREQRGQPMPGPAILWTLLRQIFLPAAATTEGPALQDVADFIDETGTTLPVRRRLASTPRAHSSSSSSSSSSGS